MTCSSTCCLGVLLGALVGPELEPTDVEPPGPRPDGEVATTVPTDPADRSAQLLEQAVAHAEEQRYEDALAQSVAAYRALPAQSRQSDSGLFVVVKAVEYYEQAYRRSRDATLAAEVQLLLEEFLASYQGLDSRSERLERELDEIRDTRLALSERYLREKQYVAAAVEARDCYEVLRPDDKRRPIGERAVLAASRAYRQAWYADGDIRHIEAAITLVDDHLARAGEAASRKPKQERAKLGRFRELAEARGGGIDEEEDLGGISPQDRSFLIASGSAIGGGLVISAGASAVGAFGFEYDYLQSGEVRSIRAQPEHIATAIPLGVLGGVLTGLAIHSMVDAGFIPPRERKILALGATTVGILGMIAGSSLLLVGSIREGDRVDARARGYQSAGFGMLVGMGAPLGAGIAALVSRRAGIR